MQIVLEEVEEILFAYVYGSFLEMRPCRDLDLGVFVENDCVTASPFKLEGLAFKLESQLRKVMEGRSKVPLGLIPPLDVRLLNQASNNFSYQVTRGRLVFSCGEKTRLAWVIGTVSSYLDIQPLRHRALKEAMLSWS